MYTVRAGLRTGWCSFATLDPWVFCPVATVNILVDGWSVGVNGSPSSPAMEVHAVSYAAEGMEPSRTPFLSFPFVSCKGVTAVVAAQALSGTTTGGTMGMRVGDGGLWVRAWACCHSALVCNVVPPWRHSLSLNNLMLLPVYNRSAFSWGSAREKIRVDATIGSANNMRLGLEGLRGGLVDATL